MQSPPPSGATTFPAKRPGILFIVSAPSGAGKTSLVQALCTADPGVRASVSFTTRAPRSGEQLGRHYHFVTLEAFERMLERGEFLESALVHGNRYGTGEAWVRAELANGTDVVLEIDWQGAQQVRGRFPEAIGIFVLPPSLPVLQRRLSSRDQDAPGVIAARLAVAQAEMAHACEYDYVIINDDFDIAVQDLRAVVRAARLRAPLVLGAIAGTESH